MDRTRLLILWMIAALASIGSVACSDDDDDTASDDDDDTANDDDDDDDDDDTLDPNCDPLVPEYCGLPFPSNFYTQTDAGTETGLRIHYGESSLPANIDGIHINPSDLNRLDGHSHAAQILAYFPGGVATDNLPPVTDLAQSLAAESPTLLLNMDTGEKVLHFCERTVRTEDPAQQVLILRPMVKLENAARYAVAFRNLLLESGEPVQPSEAFRSYRDEGTATDPVIENRRAAMEEVFIAVEEAGWERDSLQLAWDFTTASRDAVAGSLIEVSDRAYAAVDAEGAYQYVVDEVTHNHREFVDTRLVGRVRFPLFLEHDDPAKNPWDPGAHLHRDNDGQIAQNGWVTEVPFQVHIPNSVASGAKPARFLIYGHGLLGSANEINYGSADYLNQLADTYGLVLVSTNWWGLDEADTGFVAAKVLTNFSNFFRISDRFHQGVLNTSLLSDFMIRTFATGADFAGTAGPILDVRDEAYYYGNSQGGIMGVPAAAIDRNVEKAVFGVPGTIYSYLIPRSTDFVDLDALLKVWYPSEVSWELAMSVSQSGWDPVEPISFIQRLFNDPIPGRPLKKAIWQIGVGDAQVRNDTMDIAGRTMGIGQLGPINYPILDVPEVFAPFDGSVLAYYDPELEVMPTHNGFPPEDKGTHEAVRRSPAAIQQMGAFFQPDGTVEQFCIGTCDAEDH